MQVKNIDVTGVAFDGTHHVGEVVMTLEGTRTKVEMKLACRSERGADCPSTLVLYDLMTDALNQAKRTPGVKVEDGFEVDISTAKVRMA
jgi:hypothetical protein